MTQRTGEVAFRISHDLGRDTEGYARSWFIMSHTFYRYAFEADVVQETFDSTHNKQA